MSLHVVSLYFAIFYCTLTRQKKEKNTLQSAQNEYALGEYLGGGD